MQITRRKFLNLCALAGIALPTVIFSPPLSGGEDWDDLLEIEDSIPFGPGQELFATFSGVVRGPARILELGAVKYDGQLSLHKWVRQQRVNPPLLTFYVHPQCRFRWKAPLEQEIIVPPEQEARLVWSGPGQGSSWITYRKEQ